MCTLFSTAKTFFHLLSLTQENGLIQTKWITRFVFLTCRSGLLCHLDDDFFFFIYSRHSNQLLLEEMLLHHITVSGEFQFCLSSKNNNLTTQTSFTASGGTCEQLLHTSSTVKFNCCTYSRLNMVQKHPIYRDTVHRQSYQNYHKK